MRGRVKDDNLVPRTIIRKRKRAGKSVVSQVVVYDVTDRLAVAAAEAAVGAGRSVPIAVVLGRVGEYNVEPDEHRS